MVQTRPASPSNPAEAYERLMVTHVFGPLANETVRRASPSKGDRVLDAACGTAIMLRTVGHLVGDSGTLSGMDINPMMLALAEEIVKESGIAADFHLGSVDALPHDDCAFDLIYCQQAFQFFPDRSLVLREFRRVLAEDGHLVMSTWKGLGSHSYFQALDKIAYAQAGIHMFQDPHILEDQDELEQLVSNAKFHQIRIEPVSIVMRAKDPMKTARMQLNGATAGIRSLQQLGDKEKADLIDGVMAQISPILEAHTIDGMLTIPWHANLVIARK